MFRTCATIAVVTWLVASNAHAKMIGVNVLLNRSPSDAVLSELSALGEILDVIPEINAVTMAARESDLAAIQALGCVAAANPDAQCQLASDDALSFPDLSSGANHWGLDATNVTDFAGGRGVEYDGDGVYVAVIDTGLVHNWRAYFPEERIASQFARAFGGGGEEHGTVSEQPDKWEHDTRGHGTMVTSVVLGFHYSGPEQLPSDFNGVAPKAKIIPLKVFTNADDNGVGAWFSVVARALVCVANLKSSGALGDAPLVVNFSGGSFEDSAILRAAIDYAIASGVIVVSIAGNEGDAGMRFPGAYAEVISAGMVGAVGEFPSDDATRIDWIVRDISESDVSPIFVAPISARQLAGQELDVLAPGWIIPGAWPTNGQIDYTFGVGTSFASPHVAGIAAMMLQKNPTLAQVEIETILKDSALPIAAGCRDTVLFSVDHGVPPTWSNLRVVSFFDATVCWEANATGAGLVQADAALAATPLP